MKIAITGHIDIEKCFGLVMPAAGAEYHPQALALALPVARAFVERCRSQNPDVVFGIGMARGWDEVVGLAVIEKGLPLHLFIPGSLRWHRNRGPSRGVRTQAIHYDRLVAVVPKANVMEVSKHYGGKQFQFANFARNFAMIDWSDQVYSFKFFKSTGTDHAIQESRKVHKYMGNISGSPMTVAGDARVNRLLSDYDDPESPQRSRKDLKQLVADCLAVGREDILKWWEREKHKTHASTYGQNEHSFASAVAYSLAGQQLRDVNPGLPSDLAERLTAVNSVVTDLIEPRPRPSAFRP